MVRCALGDGSLFVFSALCCILAICNRNCCEGKMKSLIEFLRDVYQKNGYVAVLISVAVFVILALLIALAGGVSLGDIATWVGGL